MTTGPKSVTVEAVPFFPEVNQDAGNLDVMLRIEALASCTTRVPIDVVAVLACGSNMTTPHSADKPSTGGRDLLKMAMNFIVKQLRDGDSVAVVADSSMESLLEISGSASREQVEKKVDEFMATNGAAAALKPGLQHAVKLLDVRSSASSDRLGFIVLLSDGDDGDQTQVKWDKIMCPRRNYTVHTFGLGAAHDPKQLFSIAQESGGTYSFVRDGNLIMEALAVCLGGLKSVVAVDTRVEITTVPGAAGIKRIQHGAGFTSTCDAAKASAEVAVGTLYAGEVKRFRVVVEHKKCKPEQLQNNNQQLFTARVEYRHTPSSSLSSEPPVCVVDTKFSTRRPAVIYPGQLVPSSRVAKLRAQLEAVEMVEAFRIDVIDVGSIKKMKSAAGTLKSRWEQLKQVEALVVADSIRNCASYVQVLEGDINAMAGDLNGGGGGRGAAAYLYSWLSGHAMQRATTVADSQREEFLTEKMKEELTEAKKQQRAAVEANKRVQAAGKTAAIKEEKDERKAKKKQPMVEEAAAGGDRKVRGVLDQEAPAVKAATKTKAALKLVQDVIAERKEGAKKKEPTMAKEEAAAGGVLDLLEIIERRLECWEKLKHETPLVFPESAAGGGGVTRVLDTEALRKESIEGINQAMYKEVYLAAVHAIKQKRGNTTGTTLPTPATPN